MANYNPTEKRIFEFLSDGERHTKAEIIEHCINDKLVTETTASIYIYNLRLKLPPGLLILCEWVMRKGEYRMVRKLTDDDR